MVKKMSYECSLRFVPLFKVHMNDSVLALLDSNSYFIKVLNFLTPVYKEAVQQSHSELAVSICQEWIKKPKLGLN